MRAIFGGQFVLTHFPWPDLGRLLLRGGAYTLQRSTALGRPAFLRYRFLEASSFLIDDQGS
ncbi:MAG: hypothetical protein WKF75_19450 [Singulisphaera sp.]